jgi:hypothetical protein
MSPLRGQPDLRAVRAKEPPLKPCRCANPQYLLDPPRCRLQRGQAVYPSAPPLDYGPVSQSGVVGEALLPRRRLARCPHYAPYRGGRDAAVPGQTVEADAAEALSALLISPALATGSMRATEEPSREARRPAFGSMLRQWFAVRSHVL